jgi:hypothetical protein
MTGIDASSRAAAYEARWSGTAARTIVASNATINATSDGTDNARIACIKGTFAGLLCRERCRPLC